MGAPVSVASGEDGTAAGRTAGPPRLSPVMSSMQNLALDFIKRYFRRWAQSPTLSEIAAELGVNRKRAHELVKILAEKGFIETVPGKTRGIRLIDRTEELSEQDVLARLLADGWTIGDGSRILQPPGDPVTENGLFALPLLDHPEVSDRVGIDKDGQDQAGGARPQPGNRRATGPGT
jgi:hypothetical protein